MPIPPDPSPDLPADPAVEDAESAPSRAGTEAGEQAHLGDAAGDGAPEATDAVLDEAGRDEAGRDEDAGAAKAAEAGDPPGGPDAEATPGDAAEPDEARDAGGSELPPERIDAAEAAPVGPRAWRADAEPELTPTLRAQWAALPRFWQRALPVLAVLAGAALAVVAFVEVRDDTADEDALRREAAIARTAWAASLRQSAVPLGAGSGGGGFAEAALEPGDAEDGERYVDFFSYTLEDSSAFTVSVTSEAFRPDLAVRTPDGRRIAASTLLGTRERAEVIGLSGPGRFEIAVTSAERAATGPYEVTAGPSSFADTLLAADPVRADTLGGGVLRAGRYEAAYAVLAEPDQPVVLHIVSPAFRPRVTLLGPGGEIRQQRTLERGAAGDSLFGVVLRYRPGWDLPYTLLVSTQKRGQRGPFAISMDAVDIRAVTPNGRTLGADLGDQSWLREGRYVDAYRFRVGAGEKLKIGLRSDAFAPALSLWREERRSDKEIVTSENLKEEPALAYEAASPEPGTYVLEVSSARAGEEGVYPLGRYALTIESARPAPPPRAPSSGGSSGGGAALAGRTVNVGVARTGRSPDGQQFRVSASGVNISYPGGSRTRVQVAVSVMSIDYSGPWAPWRSFASKARLRDGAGNTYSAAAGESAGSGVVAEPGASRRGRLVFYTDGVVRNIQSLTLVAPLGGGASVSLPISL